MTPATRAALDAALAAALARRGVAGDYREGGTGTPVPAVGFMVEFADESQQGPAGRDRVRLADYTVRRAALAGISPAHPDTVTVADPDHAGRWTVLGIERRDAVSITLRLRHADHIAPTASGAREVRR